jgi:hypothetical protein
VQLNFQDFSRFPSVWNPFGDNLGISQGQVSSFLKPLPFEATLWERSNRTRAVRHFRPSTAADNFDENSVPFKDKQSRSFRSCFRSSICWSAFKLVSARIDFSTASNALVSASPAFAKATTVRLAAGREGTGDRSTGGHDAGGNGLRATRRAGLFQPDARADVELQGSVVFLPPIERVVEPDAGDLAVSDLDTDRSPTVTPVRLLRPLVVADLVQDNGRAPRPDPERRGRFLITYGLASWVFSLIFLAGGPFQVRGATRVEVRAPAAGFIREVHFDEGEHVSPGAPLLRLEVPDLAARIAQKRADIQQTGVRLQILTEEVNEQRRRVERAEQWRDWAKADRDRGGRALVEELNRLDKQIAHAQAEADAARSALDRARSSVERGVAAEEQLQEAERRSRVAEAQLAQARRPPRTRDQGGR